MERTNDRKSAEFLIPVTKNLSKVTEAIEQLSSFETESETSTQPAIDNLKRGLKNNHDQSSYDVLYDTSLENTLIDLKETNIIFWTIETPW